MACIYTKRGERPKIRRKPKPRPCKGCDGQVISDRKATLFCCKECEVEYRKRNNPQLRIVPCIQCHAALGIGGKKTARIMGISFFVVKRLKWQIGIRAQTPQNGGWKAYALPTITKQRKEHPNAGYWGATKEDWAGYLASIKKKPKDHWFIFWRNEKSARKYHTLTPEQKKVRNRKVLNGEQKIKKSQQLRLWKKNNKSKVRQYVKSYLSIPHNKIARAMRGRIREAIRRKKAAKTDASERLVGCSWAHLRGWLEAQFEPWMSWDNYGTAWHVDHIIPCAKFDLTKEDEQRACFHYTNLRPLSANINMVEGGRTGLAQQSSMLHMFNMGDLMPSVRKQRRIRTNDN